MKYLKKHNEIFGLFKKKDLKEKDSKKDSKKDSEIKSKKSMWIINPSLKLIDPSENIYKYHVDIPYSDTGWDEKFNIDNLSKKEKRRINPSFL
jgi:hypothetical protein